MSFITNIFSKKDEAIKSNSDFWNWFAKKEKDFFKTVKNHSNIERDFFRKLAPKLEELREGYFYLTGMADDNTAELILTADGKISNFVFVEELVKAAPPMPNWKITAHKPSLDIKDVGIKMNGYEFNDKNLFFYSNDLEQFPDEIDITITHNDLNAENRNDVSGGIYIFLDNFLGEMNFATIVDNLTIIERSEATKELISIEKLKSFLVWRQKEFVEKYEGTRHNAENDNYSSFEAELKNGNPLLAVINTDLLHWDGKASHPWIAHLEMKFSESNKGLPDEATYELLNTIEDKIMGQLKDSEGYLNVGRETGDNARTVFFACQEFRKPSRVLSEIQKEFSDQLEISFEIVKDKYWQSFNRYME